MSRIEVTLEEFVSSIQGEIHPLTGKKSYASALITSAYNKDKVLAKKLVHNFRSHGMLTVRLVCGGECAINQVILAHEPETGALEIV